MPLHGQGNFVYGTVGKLDWQSARENCWDFGMDLAVVESEAANIIVASKFDVVCALLYNRFASMLCLVK